MCPQRPRNRKHNNKNTSRENDETLKIMKRQKMPALWRDMKQKSMRSEFWTQGRFFRPWEYETVCFFVTHGVNELHRCKTLKNNQLQVRSLCTDGRFGMLPCFLWPIIFCVSNRHTRTNVIETSLLAIARARDNTPCEPTNRIEDARCDPWMNICKL